MSRIKDLSSRNLFRSPKRFLEWLASRVVCRNENIFWAICDLAVEDGCDGVVLDRNTTVGRRLDKNDPPGWKLLRNDNYLILMFTRSL